jgi:arachidonate 15-lipoxygenase
MADWPSDGAFDFQRLGGTNPVVLERVDAVPENFALREGQLAGLLPKGASLAGLAKGGRLYLNDYALLEGIPMGSVGGAAKYVPAPMGLFYLDDAGELKALAIQLGQEPSPETVLTPKDHPKAWLLAKTYFQTADINHHEMATHLCRTHFILEGFAVATARQLADNHPVAVLLAPHLRILIWNNFEGRELLLSSSGLATRLLAGGLAGSVEILKRSYLGHALEPVGGHARKPIEAWTFESWDLPKALEARGVASTHLPGYPYRDDGLLVWEAVEKFASRYVRLYYPSDEDITKDDELQAWVAELAAPDGAHVPGIAVPRTLDELATILTRIIFTCGPQHAAVNFPQYDMAAFAPNMPAAAFARPPEDPRAMDDPTLDAYLLQMLPSPAQAELQLQTVLKLTSYQYDRLGHYEEKDFKDPGALSLIAAFQEDLAAVQATITARNQKRAYPYPWFLPERITNSTSI